MFHRVISHTVYWPVVPWAVQRPLSALPLTLGVAPRPLAFASSRLQPWLPADDGQARLLSHSCAGPVPLVWWFLEGCPMSSSAAVS